MIHEIKILQQCRVGNTEAANTRSCCCGTWKWGRSQGTAARIQAPPVLKNLSGCINSLFNVLYALWDKATAASPLGSVSSLGRWDAPSPVKMPELEALPAELPGQAQPLWTALAFLPPLDCSDIFPPLNCTGIFPICRSKLVTEFYTPLEQA